jgi:hypothetical protein
MEKESRAMEEIHRIMEKLYEKRKGLSEEEILADIHSISERLIKEKGLNLKRVTVKEKVV